MIEATSRRLLRARRQAGLTQANLAQQLGVSPSRVSEWERGRHEPRADVLIRWEAICEKWAVVYEREEEDYLRDLQSLGRWFREYCRDHRQRPTLVGLRRWLRATHPLHLKDARAIWYGAAMATA